MVLSSWFHRSRISMALSWMRSSASMWLSACRANSFLNTWRRVSMVAEGRPAAFAWAKAWSPRPPHLGHERLILHVTLCVSAFVADPKPSRGERPPFEVAGRRVGPRGPPRPPPLPVPLRHLLPLSFPLSRPRPRPAGLATPPHRRSLPRPPPPARQPGGASPPSGAAVPLRRCGSGKLLHKGTLSLSPKVLRRRPDARPRYLD